jgi:hypothetical protein
MGAWSLLVLLFGCLAENDPIPLSGSKPLLERVEMDGNAVTVLAYDNRDRVRTYSSPMIFRRFHYDTSTRVRKEEVTLSPDSYRSYLPPGGERNWADPEIHGLSSYSEYMYNEMDRIDRISVYVPGEATDELRSLRRFEYGADGRVQRINLYNAAAELQQYWTYAYDVSGNLIEEKYYALQEGEMQGMTQTEYAYDTHPNPYQVLSFSGNPGIVSNANNVVRVSVSALNPGVTAYPVQRFDYDYDPVSGYPVGSSSGEVFIYR